MRSRRWLALAALGVLSSACGRETQRALPLDAPPGVGGGAAEAASPVPLVLVSAQAPTFDEPPGYPWLDGGKSPKPVDSLSSRFPPPSGMTRVAVARGSFAAFLRTLPLAAPGTKVVSFDGSTIREGDDPRIAAVVALDVGAADLQQCADSVVRLHAEWRWARGDRDMSYRAAAGVAMPFSGWLRGERPVAEGRSLTWQPRARPSPPDHASFRRYLDDVFAWANTGSLARDADKVAIDDLAPGDFFVLPGGPGHAVLVLDVARGDDGARSVLLGQGFMPAQSFHVLRAQGSPWFRIDRAGGAIETPFWEPFPFRSLGRLSP